jgi:hypothetical protein
LLSDCDRRAIRTSSRGSKHGAPALQPRAQSGPAVLYTASFGLPSPHMGHDVPLPIHSAAPARRLTSRHAGQVQRAP